MNRVKVVALGSSVLLLVAAVTWSALPPRSAKVSLLPPGVPDSSGAAHEPSGVPHATGRAVAGRPGGSSFLAKVFALVVPAAATEPTPYRDGGAAAIATPSASASRWTVVSVPVETLRAPGGKAKAAIAERALAASVSAQRAIDEPASDPDADWDAAAPEDGHASMTYAEANPGRARVPRRLMKSGIQRDAGGFDWYDGLGTREVTAANDRGISIDALVVVESGSRSGSRTTTMRARTNANGTMRSRSGLSSLGAAECTVAETTRFRLVKLAPSKNTPADRETTSGAASMAHGLPSPHEEESSIVVASLGPRLPGSGAAAYPGLAEPLPVATPKTVAFCPIGSIEKKTKSERWCTRADRGGVSFREGPMSFLYPNGKKRAQGTYVNGTLQGPFVEFATNGNKIAEGSYRDGKKSGTWSFWWDNGKKQSQGPYVAGDRSGVWTYFDEKGRKTSSGEVRTIANVEKKQGRWTFWNANGTKSQEGTFREGRKDGAWKSFDEKGRQVSMLLWREGEEQ